jgi:hypothetical protein
MIFSFSRRRLQPLFIHHYPQRRTVYHFSEAMRLIADELTGVDLPASPSYHCLPVATPSQPVGQTVSHYRVLRKIGGGGIGVVYEAEDLRAWSSRRPKVPS